MVSHSSNAMVCIFPKCGNTLYMYYDLLPIYVLSFKFAEKCSRLLFAANRLSVRK